MQILLFSLLLVGSVFVAANAQAETPQQSLNQYVAFLNQAVDAVTNRFQMLRTYQTDALAYRKKPTVLLRLPSSGPLEDYYYQKALETNGLTAAEKQRLTASMQALWELLNKIDETGKALETYVRLKDYQRDSLQQSDELLKQMQALFEQFSRDRETFFGQIQRVYRRYQPYLPTNAYLYTEKEMEQVVESQQALLHKLAYYLNENTRADWPLELVQRSMLEDEKVLATFGKAQSSLQYPASDMVTSFKSAIRSLQAVKKQAIDEYTFAARQSAQHGNSVYLSLLQHINQDLLATQHAFVGYSRERQLLTYPKLCPTFILDAQPAAHQTASQTAPFQDKPRTGFTAKPASAPLDKATQRVLNGYVEFINESLRQMHQMQLLVRNYQSSAELYRDPALARQRANLTYAHEKFNVPLAEYGLLQHDSQAIPAAYRSALTTQAEVLLNMLREMDGLSIELISYTTQKQYLQDQLQRSDAILDRYASLFDAFDKKKELLYNDVRRVHESYPVANPGSAWNKAGKALLTALDHDKEALFGVKAFLKLEAAQLPATNTLEAQGRALIANEYQNLKGLQRLGSSNGLCPYSPYEDVAENTLRLVEMTQKVRPFTQSSTNHPYQEFYYFYNNQLVYEYNKFCELANEPLLKAVTQPDVFAFIRTTPPPSAPQRRVSQPEPIVESVPASKPSAIKPDVLTPPTAQSVSNSTPQPSLQRDTVYVERTRIDTVYVGRTGSSDVNYSLKGYAANNMVLLLDISASMDSPVKLPLLKRSVKSLLNLLRPEDQISVVIYSGKARVALKPTSGANVSEIARAIDELQSSGDTDGNGGLRLAYKVANKNYIRAGNNRIVLATDGEFPVSDEVLQLIRDNAQQDVYLTVFTFGANPKRGQNLKKLSQLGKGSFTHITPENANLQLVLEAQARQLSVK